MGWKVRWTGGKMVEGIVNNKLGTSHGVAN